MKDPTDREDMVPGGSVGNTLYKKDFWGAENLKYSRPHYRLEKSARIINGLAQGKECLLLDVGCGPAALMPLLRPNIQYYGIDIAIHDPGPNLIEADFLETPIRFDGKRFDIIIAQGVFEYVGNLQARKFAEIADLLNSSGVFIASYVNFAHRDKKIYWPYSNVQAFDDFRQDLKRYFKIQRFFPTSHNWHHGEPNRKPVKAVNMYINVNIPFISRILAVEYFFICSPRHSTVPPILKRGHIQRSISSPARSTGSGPGQTAPGNSIPVARPSTASTVGSMHSARRGRSPAQALRPRDGTRYSPWPSKNLRYGKYCLLRPSGSCAAAASAP